MSEVGVFQIYLERERWYWMGIDLGGEGSYTGTSMVGARGDSVPPPALTGLVIFCKL
jgi:hypothetical protein